MAFHCPPEVLLRRAIGITRSCLDPQNMSSQTQYYRAAMVTELGHPMSIQQLKRTRGIPEKSVRIAIHHCGINFADLLRARGKYQEKSELPFCPGAEFAGVVTELGSGVTSIRVGDKVFGLSNILGASSEEIILPSSLVSVVPDSMPTEVASAIMCVYGTTWLALKHRAQVMSGETVLVTSAAGGVGLAAVDMAANLFNCKVIAACGSDDKCAIAKSRGAYATINYSKDKINEKVKEITEGRGADIIMENVGGDIFNACLRSIAFEGRIVVIGFASGTIPKIPANILLVKSCSTLGVFWGGYRNRNPKVFRESMDAVMEAYTRGKIHPHISKIVPLEKINEAYQYISDRKSTGKVVIDCRR